jgi:hypothetical protein
MQGRFKVALMACLMIGLLPAAAVSSDPDQETQGEGLPIRDSNQKDEDRQNGGSPDDQDRREDADERTTVSETHCRVRAQAFANIDRILGIESKEMMEAALAGRKSSIPGDSGDDAPIAGDKPNSPVVKILTSPLLRNLVLSLVERRVPSEALRDVLRLFLGGDGESGAESATEAVLSEADVEYFTQEPNLNKLREASRRWRALDAEDGGEESSTEGAQQLLIRELELTHELETIRGN